VLQLAQVLGWRRMHARPCRTKAGWRTAFTGEPGWPDVALVRGPRLIFTELKAAPKVNHRKPDVVCDCCPTPDQQAWLDALALVPGVECYVWHPEQLDEVGRVLSARDRSLPG